MPEFPTPSRSRSPTSWGCLHTGARPTSSGAAQVSKQARGDRIQDRPSHLMIAAVATGTATSPTIHKNPMHERRAQCSPDTIASRGTVRILIANADTALFEDERSRRISRTALSDKTSRLHPRRAAAELGQTYEPEVPVEVREFRQRRDFSLKHEPEALRRGFVSGHFRQILCTLTRNGRDPARLRDADDGIVRFVH